MNAYEVDALPIPRFARLLLEPANRPEVNSGHWDNHIWAELHDTSGWERAVVADIVNTDSDSSVWPDTVHDALASAGKEMSRLGEERQRLTSGFACWLIETLGIDEDAFCGMTYVGGGQAVFDQMGWHEFVDLLKRNRRACAVDLTHASDAIEARYHEASAALKLNREKFTALDAAINRVVWQLVGLAPDGSVQPS